MSSLDVRVEGSWWTARYSFFSHLEGETRSGETECCFPWLCFGLKQGFTVPTLTHSSSWVSLTFSTYLFYGDRFIIIFHVLSQNQGPCYGYKFLHSGDAFSTYIILLPWCHVFLFCGHTSAPVSQLHCGLWLMSSLFFSVWCMTLDISSVPVLENGDFPQGRAVYGHVEVSDQCSFFGDFHTFVSEAPVLQQRNKWSHSVSFTFFSLKLNFCSSSSISKLFIIKRENYVPLYVLLSSNNVTLLR